MSLIIFSITAIVACFIVYYLFDKSGFKAGLLFKFFLQLGMHLLQGTLLYTYNLGLVYLIIFVLAVFIFNLILTSIEYFVYTKTESFFTYFILGAIIEFLALLGLSVALAFILNFFLNVL